MDQTDAREANLLDALVARYRAEGFEVFVQPSRAVLPRFLGDYRPDAIAIGPNRKVAIEVVRSDGPSSKVRRLREIFSNHDDWELVVFYVSPSSVGEQIKRASVGSIKMAIDQAIELRDLGMHPAALVIGWSALEAIARILLPGQLAHSQPSGRLLEVLASEGYLTPSEADLLRSVAIARNAVAHGQLETPIEPAQLDALISALRILSTLLPKNAD
jgi:REase_AHJR-like